MLAFLIQKHLQVEFWEQKFEIKRKYRKSESVGIIIFYSISQGVIKIEQQNLLDKYPQILEILGYVEQRLIETSNERIFHLKHVYVEDKLRELSFILFEYLRNQFQSLAKDVDKHKDWTELHSWVKQIERLMIENRTPQIPEPIILAQRLANCLNPKLPPGLHKDTLQLYEEIFTNLGYYRFIVDKSNKPSIEEIEISVKQFIAREIDVYTIGLFSLYQFGAVEVQPILLKLFQQYFCSLGVELIPCVPSLIVSVLPGMEENNQENMKAVVTLLDDIRKAIGMKYFYGAFWMCVLRVPRIRNGAIKYLKSRLEQCNVNQALPGAPSSGSLSLGSVSQSIASGEENKQMKMEEMSVFESGQSTTDKFSNKEDIGDQSQITQYSQSITNTMEEADVPEDSDQKSIKQKLREMVDQTQDDPIMYPNTSGLVLSSLMALVEDENGLVRRNGLDFIISHFDIQHDRLSREDKTILLQCMFRHFGEKSENQMTSRVFKWLFGPPNAENGYDLPPKEQDVTVYIKNAFIGILTQNYPDGSEKLPFLIIQNFFRHIDIADKIIPEITYELTTYMSNFSHKKSSVMEIGTGADKKKIQVIQDQQSLNVQNHVENFITSIFSHLPKMISHLRDRLELAINNQSANLILELIGLIRYMFQSFQEIQFKDTEKQFDIGDLPLCLKRVSFTIVKSTQILDIQILFQRPFLMPGLNLMMELIEISRLLMSLNLLQKGDQERELQYINSFENFFQNLVEFVHLNKGLLSLSSKEDGFQKKQEELFSKDRKKLIDILDLSSQIMIGLQNYSLKVMGVEVTQMPDWLDCLLGVIGPEGPLQTFIAIQTFMEVLRSNEKEGGELWVLSKLKNFLIFPNDGQNHLLNIFQNLWGLLDFHFGKTSEIISFILYFELEFPLIFKEVIEDSLKQDDAMLVEFGIRRYSAFCESTANFYLQNPLQNSGVGIDIMLEYNEHENPLIKFSSRAWLSNSSFGFFQIIDPLFVKMIDQLTMSKLSKQNQEKDQLPVYESPFETQIVYDCLQKIKNIISVEPITFIDYIFKHPTSELIKKCQTNQIENFIQKEQSSYFMLLTDLCLAYLEGRTDASSPDGFKKGCARLNAFTCEFLEYLLITIPMDSVKITWEFFTKYMLNSLKILKHCINNNDYVLQVQLLNLIGAMITKFQDSLDVEHNTQVAHISEGQKYSVIKESKFLDPTQRNTFLRILYDDCYFPNLIRGMNRSQIYYVQSRYIQLFNHTIYKLGEIMDDETVRIILTQILSTYYIIIQTLQVQEEEEEEEFLKGSFLGDMSGSRAEDSKDEEQEEQKEQNHPLSQIIPQGDQKRRSSDFRISKHFSNMNVNDAYESYSQHNPVASGGGSLSSSKTSSQQHYQEVLDVVGSQYLILNYFLVFQEDDKKIQESSNQLLDVLTLRVIWGRRKESSSRQLSFKRFHQTCEYIMTELTNIFEVFLRCWNLSKYFSDTRFFSDKGCRMYNWSTFEQYNQELKEKITNLEQRKESYDGLKTAILQTLYPMINQITRESLKAVLELWFRQCPQKQFFGQPKRNMMMCKLIDILVLINVPIDIFMTEIIETEKVKNLIEFYQQKMSAPQNTFIYTISIAQQESSILFFIYVYLLYSHLNNNMAKPEISAHYWQSILGFLTHFQNSNNPQTIFWIIEILFMCSRKVNPRIAFTVDIDVKKVLHKIIKDMIFKISKFICRDQYSFSTNAETQNLQQDQKFLLVVPFSPAITTLYEEYKNFQVKFPSLNKHESEKYEIIQQIFEIEKTSQDVGQSEANFQIQVALLSTQILKLYGHELLGNCYENDEKIVKYFKEYMEIIFPLMKDKEEKNFIFNEATSSVLHTLIDQSKYQQAIMIQLQKPILDIFQGLDFFCCNRNTLQYWTVVINTLANLEDIFSELLIKYLKKQQLKCQIDVLRENGFSALFNKEIENRNKIMKFERICFVIYSGPEDRYAKSMKPLIENISEVLKDPDSAHPSIIILILFCMRILILRLNPTTLNELFRNIWPMIISILIQIFQKKDERTLSQDSKESQTNIPLTYEALKLVEMISYFQMDEFFLNQWMFVFDYFGLQFDPIINSSFDLSKNPSLMKGGVVSPFEFQPFLSNIFPDLTKVDYQSKMFDDNQVKSTIKQQRELIFQQTSVNSLQQLRAKSFSFCSYVMKVNESRLEIDKSQLQLLIQNEFIELDQNIFQK